MQVTSVGHAGFRIETKAGSILCDPWVNPAYFASWFPFPDNSTLDWDALGDCDYLYVSHLHKDHFDPENLRAHVNKDAVVLLPDYPVPDLQRELEKLGFHRFFETTDSVKHTVSGPKGDLDVMIIALRAPADGPIGDSGLVVSDGETVAFNMNDARPVDLDVLAGQFGHIDVHMLQYSGAIWYPMVYDMPARAKEAFGTQKRQRQMDRCRQYIAQVGATWVIPSAGPPCFLDPELRILNDDRDDPANIFPDQMVFLDQMRRHGHDGGLLMIPGSTADFTGAELEFAHPSAADRRGGGDLHHRQGRLHRGLRAADGAGAGRGEGPLGAGRRRVAARAAARTVRAHHVADRPDLRRHRIPGGAAAGPRDRWYSTSRNVLCAKPVPDEKFRYGFEIAPELVRTVVAGPASPTGSTRSSSPPGSRRGASAGTTSTCTRSSSA